MTRGATPRAADSSSHDVNAIAPRGTVGTSKEDTFTVVGEVIEPLPNAMFKVKLENEVVILAYSSGKIKMNRIRILTGDKVEIEMSPYDMTRGRITYRHK